MRLGLLGPSGGDLVSLGRAAEYLLNAARVDRAIYLGDDSMLEKVVVSWATRLVGSDPTDDGAWRRAGELAVSGFPTEIDQFVKGQRSRLRLRCLESLPHGDARTIEMIGDRVAVLIHDKGLLDEEDILAANLLVYGKSDAPLVKRIGARWFMTPGPIGHAEGGLAMLEDDRDDIVVTLFNVDGKRTLSETLTVTRTATLRIQGDA